MHLLSRPSLPLVKVVNPRFIFLCALFVCCTAFAFYGYFMGLHTMYLISLGATILCVVFACMHISSVNGLLTYLIIVIIAASAIGVNSAISAKGRIDAPANGTVANLICVLDSPWSMKDDGISCVVKMKDSDVYKGKWRLKVDYSDILPTRVELGAVLYLDKSYVYTSPRPFLEEVDAQSLTVLPSAIHISSERSGSVFDKIRYACINKLRDVMPVNQAGIAAALLFGEKSLLSSEDYAAFRYAGLAHTMAVSGLHVGFMMLLINYGLSRLRRFRITSFLVVSVILIGYIFVCGGSVSVSRAVIMGLLSFLASALGRRSDSLNNISIAAISLLLLKPHYIANLSFVMSFLSVFTILLLARPIQKLCTKVRIPNKISAPIAVTLSASIGVLPITAEYFHTMNLWTIPINFIALPLVELTFIVLLVSLPIALLFSSILLIPKYLILSLSYIAKLASNLPGADYILFPLGFLVPAYLVALFFMSDYMLTRHRALKIARSVTSLLLIISALAVCNMPSRYITCHVAAVGMAENHIAVIANNNKVLVVGSYDAFKYAEKFLVAKRIRKINVLILTDYKDENYDALKTFAKRYDVKNLCFDYSKAPSATISKFKEPYIILDAPIVIDEISIGSPIEDDSVNLIIENRRIIYARQVNERTQFSDCIILPTEVNNFPSVVCIIPRAIEELSKHTYATEGANFFELG